MLKIHYRKCKKKLVLLSRLSTSPIQTSGDMYNITTVLTKHLTPLADNVSYYETYTPTLHTYN